MYFTFYLFHDILDGPLRMIVRTYPDLAERVFDKCIKQKEGGDVELDFTFLEDSFCLATKETDKGPGVRFVYQDLTEETAYTYDGSGTVSIITVNYFVFNFLLISIETSHCSECMLCIRLPSNSL